jgi:hypothetical protein
MLCREKAQIYRHYDCEDNKAASQFIQHHCFRGSVRYLLLFITENMQLSRVAIIPIIIPVLYCGSK